MANRNETVEPERDSLSPPAAEAAALDKSLLIVDDDRPFGERLARAMGSRGFTPRVAASVAEGLAAIQAEAPAFAVIDLKLGDGTGLDVMKALKAKRPEAKAIILTGYGAIATAVVAVKLGAYDYLAKPVNADEIVAVLTAERGQHVDGPEHPMSADRVRWEHIQRVYEFVRAQRLGDGAPAQHASAHPAAHPRQARAALML